MGKPSDAADPSAETTAATIRIPIFPLDSVVLFPEARQKLLIFEPRYKAMTEDALADDQQIGMVLLRELEDAEPEPDPLPIYPVGCLGRIVASTRLDDGRFVIVLEGVRRFRILTEETTEKPYRIVTAELLDEPGLDALTEREQQELTVTRDELQSQLLELTRSAHPESAEALRERMEQLDPLQLAHAVAFGLDCTPLEKQALLETSGPLARCRQVAGYLEFRRAEARLPGTPRTVN